MNRITGHRGRSKQATFGVLALHCSVSALVMSICLAGQPLPAFAQANGGAQTAASNYAFSIASQPLSGALMEFGTATGIQFFVGSIVVRDIQSPGASGSLTAEEALTRLLSGTGLTYRFTNATTVTIERATASGSVLPPVVVEGTARGETAWGPVEGYIATRSGTGTKTDAALIDIPQSITVVGKDQFTAQGATGVQQALRYAAGVSPETRGNFTGYDIMYGRGFVLDRYVDGMKLQGASGFITPQTDIYNIERLEVMRGPDSVLYGQASPGGLVNAVTKRPTAEAFGQVGAAVGNRETYKGMFDLGGPLDDQGKMLYRLTGIGSSADSQVDFVESERVGISPAITWLPNDDTSLTLIANYQYDPHVGLYNFVPARGTVQANPGGQVPTNFYAGDPSFDKMDRTQYSTTLLGEHRFDSIWTGRVNARYMHDDGNLNQVLPLSQTANGLTLNRYAQVTYEELDAFNLDNQAQAKFSTGALDHTLLLGVDYQKTFWDQRLGQGLVPALNIFAPIYYQAIPAPAITTDTSQTTDQIGLYVQDHFKLDRWTFLAGARQDWANSETENNFNGSQTTQSDDKLTWRTGAVYSFENGIAPYASYATSFNPQPGTTASGTAFVPTTGEQYEAGIKYQPTGFNSFITLSAFQLKQQNVPTPDPANIGQRIQTGEVRTRGVELEGKVALNDNLNIVGSYTYLDPIVTKSNTAGVAGKQALYTPEQMASVWADYTIRRGQFAGLGLGSGVRFVGASYGNDLNTIKVPEFTLVDAALFYDLSYVGDVFKGWKAQINATNLFDKDYVSECTNNNCLYGMGRTVLGTVSYNW